MLVNQILEFVFVQSGEAVQRFVNPVVKLNLLLRVVVSLLKLHQVVNHVIRVIVPLDRALVSQHEHVSYSNDYSQRCVTVRLNGFNSRDGVYEAVHVLADE